MQEHRLALESTVDTTSYYTEVKNRELCMLLWDCLQRKTRAFHTASLFFLYCAVYVPQLIKFKAFLLLLWDFIVLINNIIIFITIVTQHSKHPLLGRTKNDGKR